MLNEWLSSKEFTRAVEIAAADSCFISSGYCARSRRFSVASY